ncbi:MAG: hypothetical protein V9E81_14120 [Marmoricola sp.]|jgi:hypothetical protein
MSDQAPQRVKVTSPRTVVRRRPRQVTSEIDAHTEVGEIYLSSLLGAQFGLAVLVLIPITLIGIGLPLVFVLFPQLSEVCIFGLPITWLAVAFGIFPVLIGLGWVYVRAAERTERDFIAAVEE